MAAAMSALICCINDMTVSIRPGGIRPQYMRAVRWRWTNDVTECPLMFGSVVRGVLAGVLGALLGAACATAAYVRDAAIVLQMDRDVPPVTSGFYPGERDGEVTFAWTGSRAEVRLAGLDRRAGWECVVRARGARPDGSEQPVVSLAVDGITVASRTASNDYQDFHASVTSRAGRSGVILAIASGTFVPGTTDSRQLGIQVDSITCAPQAGVRPPGSTLGASAVAGALFAGTFALIGLSVPAATLGAFTLSVAQAVPLSSGPAPYSTFPSVATALAVLIAAALLVVAVIARRVNGAPLSGAALFVLAFSSGVLYLQLLGLMHPRKDLVDAVFHAHRLGWVLDGRLLFTQPMPDGVRFPYAIGLYVFAAPWSALVADHVWLLRVSVSTAHAIAGAVLYPAVMHGWGRRLAGAAAVVLYHCVLLPYVVIGNANMTFAFGQAIATVALAAAATWAFAGRGSVQVAGLFALTSLAFLSHVGVFPILFMTLVASAVLWWWDGAPALSRPARVIAVVAIASAVFSVVTYYGRFGEAYESVRRVIDKATSAPQGDAPDTPPGSAGGRSAVSAVPRAERVVRALALTRHDIGWPLLLLAAVGAARLLLARARDRLAWVVVALVGACTAFVAFSVAAPVEPRFLRYADEFVSRVNYTAIPAAALLAGAGFEWAWNAGTLPRSAATLVGLLAPVAAVRQWIEWMR
jgi:hypothetical protein